MNRLLLLSLSLTSLAASASVFDDVVNELVGNNLGLRVETVRSEASVESMKAENTLEGPEIEFGRVWGAKAEYGNKWDLSVSQGFDWPGLYAARREAARTATTAMQFLREADLLDARRDARALLIDYVHNTQVLNLQREIADNIDSMVVYYRRAAEEGLESEREAIVSSLQEFNGGLDVDQLLAKVGDDYPDLDIPRLPAALSVMRERDPRYAAAKAQAEAAESLVKVDRLSAYPGFSIGFAHNTEGDEHFNGFSVGITLPTWSRRHSSKAARLEAEAALMDADIALHKRKASLVADCRRIDSYRMVLDEYAPVVGDKSYYELLRKALKAGQISFLTYIEELNYFIAAHRDYLDVLYEYNLAIARTKYYE